MVKDNDHPSKYLKSHYPSKFPPIKILHYTVVIVHYWPTAGMSGQFSGNSRNDIKYAELLSRCKLNFNKTRMHANF